jgi:hypothetical protein
VMPIMQVGSSPSVDRVYARPALTLRSSTCACLTSFGVGRLSRLRDAWARTGAGLGRREKPVRGPGWFVSGCARRDWIDGQGRPCLRQRVGGPNVGPTGTRSLGRWRRSTRSRDHLWPLDKKGSSAHAQSGITVRRSDLWAAWWSQTAPESHEVLYVFKSRCHQRHGLVHLRPGDGTLAPVLRPHDPPS